MKGKKGELFLLPTPLSDIPPEQQVPPASLEAVRSIRHFICETPKSARRFLKGIRTEPPLEELELLSIGKHSDPAEHPSYLRPCEKGENIGLLSDAGCPAIADPGASIVGMAHQRNIPVRPLIGPSSFTLALMASGLNGQCFSFHGYAPYQEKELSRTIEEMNRRARNGESQLIMEAPHRNERLFKSLLSHGGKDLSLCIARDLTGPKEFVRTLPIPEWKEMRPELHKIPALFILGLPVE